MRFSPTQWVLVFTPPLLLGSCWLVFSLAGAALGARAGYFAGFLFYWIVWCLLLPALLLGGRLRAGFRPVGRPLGAKPWLALVLLLWPLALGFGYAFPQALPKAGWLVVAASLALALVNAVLEELLWRATYLAAFPGSAFWGWLYPSLGFAVWHYAPQAVFPSAAPGGATALVIVAGLVGLGWGYVARATGTSRWTAASHALFDFSGLGARIYFP